MSWIPYPRPWWPLPEEEPVILRRPFPFGALPTAPPPFTSAGISCWYTIPISYTLFNTVASTTSSKTLFAMDPGGVLEIGKFQLATAFTGGAISVVTFGIGITGNNTRYYSAGVGPGSATGVPTAFDTNMADCQSASAWNVTITATATSANLSALTAGAATISLKVSTPP